MTLTRDIKWVVPAFALFVLVLHPASVQTKQGTTAVPALQSNTDAKMKAKSQVVPRPGTDEKQLPQAPVITLKSDKDAVQVGETVNIALAPADVVSKSAYIFNIDFGDGIPLVWKKGQSEMSHFYRKAGSYQINVSATVPFGAEIFDPMPVIENKLDIKVNGFSATAEPMAIEAGNTVLIQAVPVTQDTNLRFRFDFKDGSPVSDWQSDSQIKHEYISAGTYAPSVEVGRIGDNGYVDPLDSALIGEIDVTPREEPTQTAAPSPTVAPKPDGQTPWGDIVIVLLIAIAALAGASAASIGVFKAHRIYKNFIRPRPTFAAHPDPGTSVLRAESEHGLTFDSELRLNANTDGGQHDVDIEGSEFVTNIRR